MLKKLIVPLILMATLIAMWLVFTNWMTPQTQLSPQSYQESSRVYVYSSRKEALIKPLFDAFTEQTGIDVRYITDKAPVLIERLVREGKESPADMLITVDVGNLGNATSKDLFQPTLLRESGLALDPHYRDEQWHWVGLSKRIRPVFYNKERVNPQELSSYEALADERWKGRLLVRSSSNIYNQSLIASMIHANGEEATQQWIDGLVRNFARPPQGGDTDQLRALGAGEGDIALANHYYYARLLASDNDADQALAKRIGIFFPNQEGRGAHVNLSGAGITRHAPNRMAAEQLLAFLLSDEAQAIYAEINHEYPVIADISLSPLLASFGSFSEDLAALPYLASLNRQAMMMADSQQWR